MKKLKTAILLLLILSIVSSFAWAASEDPVKVYTKKITINKITRTVNIVDVDLKNKNV